MPFQPFGYRFQVDLNLPPANAKAAIRQRMKPWFEVKGGARGWIVGPFICIWLHVLNSGGPMLFGTIRRHNFRTRISGRAGSDLNGVAWFVALAVALIVFAAFDIFSGESSGQSFFVLALFLVMLPLMLWMSHKDRGEAEPLVRFLEETLSGPRPKPPLEFNDVTILKALTLEVDGEIQDQPITAQRIAEALQSIEDDDGYMVIGSTSEKYIQTAAEGGYFVIEKGEMGSGSQLEAVRNDDPNSTWLKRNFTIEETLATLLAFVTDAPSPGVVEWRTMS